MDVVYTHCCGLDVHKKTVVASLYPQYRGAGAPRSRTFRTMTADLLALADWLQESGCTHVAMESTGVYWRPVYNLLEGPGARPRAPAVASRLGGGHAATRGRRERSRGGLSPGHGGGAPRWRARRHGARCLSPGAPAGPARAAHRSLGRTRHSAPALCAAGPRDRARVCGRGQCPPQHGKRPAPHGGARRAGPPGPQPGGPATGGGEAACRERDRDQPLARAKPLVTQDGRVTLSTSIQPSW